MDYLVHYSEIALKGENRPFFENKLKRNIERATGGKVKKYHGGMMVQTDNPKSLASVFGISWYAPVYKAQKQYQPIEEKVLKKLKGKIKKKLSFAVKVKRADKSFPSTSQRLAEKLGQRIVDRYGLGVDLDEPDLPVFVEISKHAFIFFEKKKGLGGLPVGVSGNVLSLISGGIDSAVSSYLMAKRGCSVNLLHFHVFRENKKVKETKIKQLVDRLKKYQIESNIFLAPYFNFQLSATNFPSGYELIVFRRFMAKVGEKVAKKKGCQALVLGDNLGQVASQTLENISAVDRVIDIPVFRPLLTFDKQEIIDLAKKIGTYKTSIKSYKDCCSIISRHPKTKPRPDMIERVEKGDEMDKIVSQTLQEIEVLNI